MYEENCPNDGRLIKAYGLRHLDGPSEDERYGEPLPLNNMSLLTDVTLTGFRTDGQGQVAEKSFPPPAGGWVSLIGEAPFGEGTLSLPDTPEMKTRFEDESVEDILFVITYSGSTQECPL